MKSMKATAAKAMTKGALLKAIASENDLKPKTCSEVINNFVAIATNEVKKTGVFAIPGLCRIKTRTKPATKAGTRVMFGKEMKVKAKPARGQRQHGHRAARAWVRSMGTWFGGRRACKLAVGEEGVYPKGRVF